MSSQDANQPRLYCCYSLALTNGFRFFSCLDGKAWNMYCIVPNCIIHGIKMNINLQGPWWSVVIDRIVDPLKVKVNAVLSFITCDGKVVEYAVICRVVMNEWVLAIALEGLKVLLNLFELIFVWMMSRKEVL